ncbi:hypothetical protein V8D89_011865 [Ganoderma adspersum]
MTDREMDARTRARSLQMGEVLEETDRGDDQYQCAICKVFLYLSQITCPCTTRVVCIDHVDLLCKCPPANHVLRKRFNDIGLQDIQAQVSERAAIPTIWRNKLKKLLDESPSPPLKSLKAIFAEGERIQFPLAELKSLQKCVSKANEWLEAANAIIARKPGRKRARKSRGRSSTATVDGLSSEVAEEVVEKPDRTLDDLYGLLDEVSNLGFDAPEIGQLRQIAREAEEIRDSAKGLLARERSARDREGFVHECRRLIVHSATLNVLVDEIVEVDKIVLREQLLKDLVVELEDENLSLEDIRGLKARADACSLPMDNLQMQRLCGLYKSGTAWEDKAKRLLEKKDRSLDELEEFMQPRRNGPPVDPEILEHIVELRKRGREYEKQAKIWLLADVRVERPQVQDVVKLVADAQKDFAIPAVQDLQRTVAWAQDLEGRSEAVLNATYNGIDDKDIFETMGTWRDYAKKHLTMFSLTNFQKLEAQLELHNRWVQSLPWYCAQHKDTHGQPILDDVVESTRPEDDLPPSDEYFTCICTTPVRPPAGGQVSDAVQCDHCFARFHGVCAANGGSCPFCDHHHWNGTIHKERSWHFCYLPTIMMHAPDISKYYSEEWKQLEIIVHRVDRLCGVIGQFLSFLNQPANQRVEYIPQVRHYMRKLYKIQFAVSPNPEVSFGLELASLHRVLAGQPAPTRMKKRRRPKFVFGQDQDKDWLDGTRCICRGRTNYLLNYPTVECELCGKLYHGGCVFFPVEAGRGARFMCPLCCVRKNRVYPYSEVRVKHVENPEQDLFVDTKEMLDTFSKDIVYMRLPPPYTQTLFVELLRFTPGQPDNIAANGASISTLPSRAMSGPSNTPPMSVTNGSSAHPRSMHPPHSHHPHSHHSHSHSHSQSHSQSHPHSHSMSAPPPAGPSYDNGRQPSHLPPPPPWALSLTSRWSSAAAAAAPPGPSRPAPPPQSPAEQMRSPITGMQTPPLASRKRKYPEDVPPPHGPPPPDDRLAPAPLIRSPKRHHSTVSPSQPSAAPRSSQGMSPSLAMMLSPTPSADLRSPTRQQPPPVYSHGHSRSIPPSPGRGAPPEDPNSHHRAAQKPKVGYPPQNPAPRPDDDRWSPSLPPPPRH